MISDRTDFVVHVSCECGKVWIGVSGMVYGRTRHCSVEWLQVFILDRIPSSYSSGHRGGLSMLVVSGKV